MYFNLQFNEFQWICKALSNIHKLLANEARTEQDENVFPIKILITENILIELDENY
jgi:hypothetical protein